jgi:hypothetical protein
VLACYDENRASRTDVIEVLNVIEIAELAVANETPVPVAAKKRRKSA